MQKQPSGIRLIELFASVQGETSLTGVLTTFIRLAQCNLRCTWCDTTYSFGRGEESSVDAILEKVAGFGCKYVCVTGGEPLLQANVFPLMKILCDLGYIVSLETGGSLSTAAVDPRVRCVVDIKCPGSAMEAKNHWHNLEILRPHDEVKFVLADRKDYDYAKEVCTKYSLYGREKEVLFSPVHGILEVQKLISWMLEDQLPARLNLQVHKFIWDPQTRGV